MEAYSLLQISLNLYFDFSTSTIASSAVLSLAAPFSGDLVLDTRSLTITSVIDPIHNTQIPFSLSNDIDPIKGQSLTVSLTNNAQILITFVTSPASSALQWLTPPQTFNKKFPFVYTQCHPIHARSIFPCQDTPTPRVRYNAKLNIPYQLSAVMSARHVERRAPLVGGGDSGLACDEMLWCAEGRVVEEFVMEQPMVMLKLHFRWLITRMNSRVQWNMCSVKLLSARPRKLQKRLLLIQKFVL